VGWWVTRGVCALQFGDGSFDVAFDKGGLDALMGDEGQGADTAGAPGSCCMLRSEPCGSLLELPMVLLVCCRSQAVPDNIHESLTM
jgi:hypothetical protein